MSTEPLWRRPPTLCDRGAATSAVPSANIDGSSQCDPDRQTIAEQATAVDRQTQTMLVEVFAALDRERVAYCVLHGYDALPRRIRSDVDMLVSADTSSRRLAQIFGQLQHSRLVRHSRGGVETFVLASAADAPTLALLQLDVSRDVDLDGRLLLYRGHEVLRDRRRNELFFVPAVGHEFCATLLRRLAKGHWQPWHGDQLTRLYRQDPQACDQQLRRVWNTATARRIGDAAVDGQWQSFLAQRRALLRQAIVRTAPRHPLAAAGLLIAGVTRRIGRWGRPSNAMHVTFLGPDGCGKSSVIAGIQQQLSSLFPHSQRFSFPPRLLQRNVGTPSEPHALQPRSPWASAVRAVLYWGTYYGPGYWLTVYPARVHGRLVVHDRHLIDALVDPRRYRYDGPAWLLRLLWRLVPAADMVVLLDAPAETIQQRKQEVPPEETARQCIAYRQLVASLSRAHTVDAAQPLDAVVRQVCERILQIRAERTAP